MELRRYDTAGAFYERSQSFLLAREAEHNLTLGICLTQIARPDLVRFPPYFATVEEGGDVIATAVRTPPYNLVLSVMESGAPLAEIAQDVLAVDNLLPGVVGPASLSQAFAEMWHRLVGGSYRKTRAMRIFQLDSVKPPSGVPGKFRRARPSDRKLILRWLQEFHNEALGDDDPASPADLERMVDTYFAPGSEEMRGYVLWEDRKPVSMAAYAGPTPNGMRVNAVYTPPAGRQRGYASACVASLSQMLLDRGRRFCFLFTDLANPTSNHIYQVIGFRPVCDVDEFKFEPAA